MATLFARGVLRRLSFLGNSNPKTIKTTRNVVDSRHKESTQSDQNNTSPTRTQVGLISFWLVRVESSCHESTTFLVVKLDFGRIPT